MPKLKLGVCCICQRKITRHDKMRTKIKVGNAYREAHNACLEKKK